MTDTIEDIATVVRSKNAGPFTLTFDVFFPEDDYNRVKRERPLNTEVISNAFQMKSEDILDIYYLDNLNAIKISIKRPIPSGDPLDSDIYGAQQHTPLMGIEIDK